MKSKDVRGTVFSDYDDAINVPIKGRSALIKISENAAGAWQLLIQQEVFPFPLVMLLKLVKRDRRSYISKSSMVFRCPIIVPGRQKYDLTEIISDRSTKHNSPSTAYISANLDETVGAMCQPRSPISVSNLE